jgi:hypothetical protein
MLLSELQFASFLTYAPHGTTDEMLTSKRITYQLKLDQKVKLPSESADRYRPMSSYLAEFLAGQFAETPLRDFLGPEVSLVPVPIHSLRVSGGLWVPERLAIALVRVGLGKEVAPILERIQAIPKSATSAGENRPKAKTHYDSLSVIPLLEPPRRIVLIDDVITRGATLLGAASRLAETFPQSDIRGFAMIRTISNPDEFVQIENPCAGIIRLHAGRTFRDP